MLICFLITDVLSHSCTYCLVLLPVIMSVKESALDEKLKVESQVNFVPPSVNIYIYMCVCVCVCVCVRIYLFKWPTRLGSIFPFWPEKYRLNFGRFVLPENQDILWCPRYLTKGEGCPLAFQEGTQYGRCIEAPILYPGARRELLVSSTPRQLYLLERNILPVVQDDEWASKLVLMGPERKASIGDRNL